MMNKPISRRSFLEASAATALAVGGIWNGRSYGAASPSTQTNLRFPDPKDLPSLKNPPDPLLMNDGTRVTTPEQWKKRREEMKEIISYYSIGNMPPPPGNVKGVEQASVMLQDGKTKFKRVHLTFGPMESLALDVGIFVPPGDGPFPTIVWTSFHPTPTVPGTPHSTSPASGRGSDERGSDAETIARSSYVADLLGRGYALLTYRYTQSAIDNPTAHSTGYFLAYPEYDWGSLAVFAWTMSRCVDYLETVPWADKTRLIATGHSRLGKTALIAGAFDERFSLVAPAGSGAMGTGLFRVNGKANAGKEGLKEYTDSFWYHCSPRLKEFGGDATKLPFDQHWMMALAAPRRLISLEGLTDPYCNGKAFKASYLAAKPVFDALKIPDQIGFNFLPHAHQYAPGDWTAMLDFADQQLLQKKVDRKFDQFPPDALLG